MECYRCLHINAQITKTQSQNIASYYFLLLLLHLTPLLKIIRADDDTDDTNRMIMMIPTLRTLDSSSAGDKPYQLTLNLATQSSVLLNLLHRRRMRGSLTVSTGNKPTGRSFTCSGKQHRHRQRKHGLPTRYTRAARYVVKLLSSQKNKPIFQDPYWYIEMLPIISIDFVKSFGQRGVNNQLVTAPVLRRRFSLSSLIFAFHYISQHLETQQHQHRPSSF